MWLLLTIIWLHIYNVSAIKLEAHLEFLKTYFDENEDTILADIIEKIRKLSKSRKIYFSQVTTLLKIPVLAGITFSRRCHKH